MGSSGFYGCSKSTIDIIAQEIEPSVGRTLFAEPATSLVSSSSCWEDAVVSTEQSNSTTIKKPELVLNFSQTLHLTNEGMLLWWCVNNF